MLKSFVRVSCTSVHGFKSFKKPLNPGVQRRLNIFKADEPELDKLMIDEQQLESYESDFSDAGAFYDANKRESRKLKNLINFKRFERKYFGPTKNLNLLSWSEKEQIRYLYNSDPAKWTPEKLSLSFPATVDVIQKILKSQWKPQSIEKIKKHDQSVSKNWKAIKSGEMKLPQTFEEHINKFMNRKESHLIRNIAPETALATERLEDPPASCEFADIIKSYKQNVDSTGSAPPSSEQDGGSVPDYPSETYVLEENKSSRRYRHYTLETLRKEMRSQGENDKSKVDEYFLKENAQSCKNTSTGEYPIDLLPVPDEFGTYKKDEIRKALHYDNEVLEKIVIPKEKKKKSAVYKVKNSYYDDQGEFLYKVPGMS